MIPRAKRGIGVDVREPESAEVNIEAFDAVWLHVKRHTSRFWGIKKKQQRQGKNKLEINKYTPEQRRAAQMLLQERRGQGQEPSDHTLVSFVTRAQVKKDGSSVRDLKTDAETRKPLSREPSFLHLLKDDAEEAIAALFETPPPASPKSGNQSTFRSLTFAQPVAGTGDSTAMPEHPNPASDMAKAPAEMPRNEPRPSSAQKRLAIPIEDVKEQAMSHIRTSVAQSCGGKKAISSKGRVPENVVLRSSHHKTDNFSNLADVRLVGLLHEPHAWQPLEHEVAAAQGTGATGSQKETKENHTLHEPPLSSLLIDAHAPKEPVVEHIPRHFKSDLLWLHPPRSIAASKAVVEERHEFDQKVVYEVPPVEYADEATAALIARQRRRQGVREAKDETKDKGNKAAGAGKRMPISRYAQTSRPPSKEKQVEVEEPTLSDQPVVPGFSWGKSIPASSINSRMPRLSARQSYEMRRRQADKAAQSEKAGRQSSGVGSTSQSSTLRPPGWRSSQGNVPSGGRDTPEGDDSQDLIGGPQMQTFGTTGPPDFQDFLQSGSSSGSLTVRPGSRNLSRRTELNFHGGTGSSRRTSSGGHLYSDSPGTVLAGDGGLYVAEVTEEESPEHDKRFATPSSERSTAPSRGAGRSTANSDNFAQGFDVPVPGRDSQSAPKLSSQGEDQPIPGGFDLARVGPPNMDPANAEHRTDVAMDPAQLDAMELPELSF